MTIQMIITLAIVIGMIVMIMSDKFAFGAPPLIACVLLVLTGCATMSEAFAGFVDKNVIMIAGFMVVMAALEKTSLIDKVKATMFNMASKGGYRNYILLLIVVMLGASVMSGTGYYVLVLSLVSTIPYHKNMPISSHIRQCFIIYHIITTFPRDSKKIFDRYFASSSDLSIAAFTSPLNSSHSFSFSTKYLGQSFPVTS
mgnify:CR=1 FL=1